MSNELIDVNNNISFLLVTCLVISQANESTTNAELSPGLL